MTETEKQIDQLETLRDEIEAGNIDTALEWLEAAIKVLKKQNAIYTESK